MKLVHVSKKSGEKLICRFGFHTSFLTEKENGIQANFDLFTVDPNELKKKHSKEYEDFKVQLRFVDVDQDSPFDLSDWNEINEVIGQRCEVNLFGKGHSDYEEVL